MVVHGEWVHEEGEKPDEKAKKNGAPWQALARRMVEGTKKQPPVSTRGGVHMFHEM